MLLLNTVSTLLDKYNVVKIVFTEIHWNSVQEKTNKKKTTSKFQVNLRNFFDVYDVYIKRHFLNTSYISII